MEDDSFDARAELLAVNAKRDALEAEANAIRSELESRPESGGAPAGVTGSLIDDEGYPRADLDIYRIRGLRGRHAVIQTDHKALMKRVEELLPLALAPSSSAPMEIAPSPPPPAVAAPPPAPAVVAPPAPLPVPKRAFAKITAVLDQSPAARCGLMRGDRLLRYGTCVSMDGVKQYTMDHVNRTIDVLLKRELRPEGPLLLKLKPEAWSGNGVLGCVFLACDDDEDDDMSIP